MSEFDQFESAEPVQTEEDPAAAFLAREQDDLAALEGDEFVSSETPQTGEAEDAFAADAFGSEEPPALPTSAADAAMFDPLGDAQTIPQEDIDFGAEGNDDFAQQSGGEESGDLYTAIKQVDTQRAEPEKIRIWRENQAEMLVRKDAGSEEKEAEWREIAKKELEDWYKHKDDQLEKAVKNNKEAEAAFLEERDEVIPGHEWERICRHCDFNPKSSRTSKDISRMRSILLQLKQSPLRQT